MIFSRTLNTRIFFDITLDESLTYLEGHTRGRKCLLTPKACMPRREHKHATACHCLLGANAPNKSGQASHDTLSDDANRVALTEGPQPSDEVRGSAEDGVRTSVLLHVGTPRTKEGCRKPQVPGRLTADDGARGKPGAKAPRDESHVILTRRSPEVGSSRKRIFLRNEKSKH